MPPPRKYRRLAEHLRECIRSGRLEPDGRLPSYQELRQRWKITQATIDSAFALLQREGLIIRRPGLGIFAAAASQAEARSDEILVLSDIPLDLPPERHRGGWSAAVMFGAIAACQRAQLRVRLANPLLLSQGEVRMILAHPPSGLLYLPTVDTRERRNGPAAALLAQDIPRVFWNCEDPPPEGAMVIEHDHHEGAYQLTCWLLRRGIRRPLQLNVGPERRWMQARREGHLKAMREAGLDPLPLVSLPSGDGTPTTEEAFLAQARSCCGALAEFLVGPGGPIDAFLAPSDGSIWQLARACRLCGREPNRDVALVGYDNYWQESPERRWEPGIRPLATIDKMNIAIGADMVAMIHDALAGRPPGPHRLAAPTLVETQDIPVEQQ